MSIPLGQHLGAEFMPRLDEGDLLVEAQRLPSASLEDAVPRSTEIENVIRKFPEVKTVFCKTGRPEIANDVMGVHQTDVWVMLKPVSQWPQPKTRDELIEELSVELNQKCARRRVWIYPADRNAGRRTGRRGQSRCGIVAVR